MLSIKMHFKSCFTEVTPYLFLGERNEHLRIWCNLSKEITESEKLTGFADYKMPQQLRKLGLISYKVPLNRFVDQQINLTSHEQMEVEIRAATITVIALLSQKLKIQANKLDSLLWMECQKFSSGTSHPYHRTLSLGY
jgi:hypothetical protein